MNRVAAQTFTAGGKGTHVAAFLAERAGRAGRVTTTGFLGSDDAAPFEALFRERGIEDRCLRLPGASRVDIKVVDRLGPEGPRGTDINLPGLVVPEAAPRDGLRGRQAGRGRAGAAARRAPPGAP
ncbi:hypothetical protein [Sorangium atrum]|uniref:Carbohydrate kinase PfkB domain-containing protein n=1 Tax=Sorangium atrum TaxID=2995308 RepID=A0ABT5CEL9_9BACT|nr:hypothetical protein [Sorangium aterium]MDC0684889.1 hypothetical protein [Sorangium aterium]